MPHPLVLVTNTDTKPVVEGCADRNEEKEVIFRREPETSQKQVTFASGDCRGETEGCQDVRANWPAPITHV
jgi:hypothetical protein